MNLLNIGENIKKYRKEKKLTQPQLASLINKSESSVRKYENGEVTPSMDILKQIADILDLPLIDLIVDNDNFVDSNLYQKFINELGSSKSSIYLKPSEINEINYETEAMGIIETLLRSKYVQDKYNYNYFDLTEEEFSEIYEFILEMLDLKLSKVKKDKSK